MRTCRFNRPPNAVDFMRRQIVHDDGLAARERRDKDLLHITEKHRPIHRAINHTRCGHSALAQSRHERDILAMSSRCIADQALASQTASSLPHHGGASAGLVDKHQPCGVKHALLSLPTSARAGALGPPLLCRIQSFFLKVMSRRSKKRHTAVRLAVIFAFVIAATISSNVMSGCSLIRPRIKSSCSSTQQEILYPSQAADLCHRWVSLRPNDHNARAKTKLFRGLAP